MREEGWSRTSDDEIGRMEERRMRRVRRGVEVLGDRWDEVIGKSIFTDWNASRSLRVSERERDMGGLFRRRRVRVKLYTPV